MHKLIRIGVIAMALGCVLPSVAQALELRCLVTHQFYERRGEVVTSAPDRRGSMTITVDLATGAFVSGDSATTAMVSATEIVALGGDSNRLVSLWVINRATGEIRAVTSARSNVNLVYLTAQGQCQTSDGATQF